MAARKLVAMKEKKVKRRKVDEDAQDTATGQGNKEEEEVDEKHEEELIPRSVRVGECMVESYTFYSDEGRAVDTEEEWIVGIDEAGRGPVVGPQVYAAAYCRAEWAETLKELGVADSKTLTHERRTQLLSQMDDHKGNLEWAVRVMSPQDISEGMLRKVPYNLNAQSHDATFLLIQSIIDRGIRIKEVFVDTVGPPAAYKSKLSGAFPSLSFTVASKADALYPIVSAASIAAKVTRDAALKHWTFAELSVADDNTDKDEWRSFGSGYPSDPNTQGWLERCVDPVFGLPNVVRFSWATVTQLLDRKAHKAIWNDDDKSDKLVFSREQPHFPGWRASVGQL